MLFGTRRSLLSAASSIVYLLLDRFTTDAAAPLASPRTAEPGPGTLTLVQTDGQFSISGGALQIPTQATPVVGDLGLYSSGLSRVAGRTVLGSLTKTGGTFWPFLGWHINTLLAAASPSIGFSLQLVGTNDIYAHQATGAFLVASHALATEYQTAVVLRSSGGYVLFKGGAFSEWTLLWVFFGQTTTPVYAVLSNFSGVAVLDNLRVTDLPAPWNTDYGIATQRLSGSRSAGDTFAHEANALIEATVTTRPSAGQLELRFRVQDANNYWQITVDSTGALDLDEVVAGVVTQRGTAAGVIANGDRIMITAAGTTIRVYEADTLRITYASATNFQTATAGRLETLGTAGVVSDIVSWPRALSGAALSALNAV